MKIPNDPEEQMEAAKREIARAIETEIKPLIGTAFDEIGYYYDSDTGKVLHGKGKDVWNIVLLRAAARSIIGGMGFVKPARPMRIDLPLDEESLRLLYGDIEKVEPLEVYVEKPQI